VSEPGKVKSTYSLTLGANESYFISYESKQGTDNIQSSELPQELHDFIFEKDVSGTFVRKFSTLKVALGPYNKSWWATDTVRSKWSNLLKQLSNTFNGLRGNNGSGLFNDPPASLTLGCNDSFFMVTKGGAKYWAVAPYRELDKLIDESLTTDMKLQNLVQLVLHPYRLDCWVLQTKSGALFSYNLAPHMKEGFESISKAVQEDARKAVSAQGLLSQLAELEAVNAGLEQQRMLNLSVSRLAAMVLMNAVLGVGSGFGSSS
jgi:hypothetical protein